MFTYCRYFEGVREKAYSSNIFHFLFSIDTSARKTHLYPMYGGVQCKTCGERMDPVKMRGHMDNHFRETRIRKTGLTCRGWFGNDWSIQDVVENTDEKKKMKRKLDKEEKDIPVASSGKQFPKCDLCQETFDQKYKQVCTKVVILCSRNSRASMLIYCSFKPVL